MGRGHRSRVSRMKPDQFAEAKSLEDNTLEDKSLEARVADLEGEVKTLRRSVANLNASLLRVPAGPAVTPPPPPFAPTPRAPIPAPTTPAVSPAGGTVAPLSSETALKWGGIALVVLGVVFAVSTAISRGWIGPELQLTGAVAFAVALLAQGGRIRSRRDAGSGATGAGRRRAWSDAFFVGGILSLCAVVASSLFVGLTSQGTGLVAAVGVGAVGFALAARARSEWAGLATVTAAGLVALALDLLDRSQAVVAIWSLSFTTAAVIVASLFAFHRLRLTAQLLGLLAATAVVLSHPGGGLGPVDLVVLGAVAVALLLAPSIGDRSSLPQTLEIQLSLALAPWLGLMTDTAIGDLGYRGSGLVYLAAAGLVTAAAVGLSGAGRWPMARVRTTSLLIGAGVATTVALAFLIDGRPFFLAAAAQGLGLMYLYRRFEPSPRVLINSVALLALAGGFLLLTALGAWSEPASSVTNSINLGILLLGAAAVYLTPVPSLRSTGALGLLAATMLYVGSILVHLPQGQAAVSLAWALMGVGVIVAGTQRRDRSIGMVGLGVLALTVAKLLTVDLAEVDTLWRAGLFLLIGLGFLRLGLSLPRLMGLEDSADQTQESHP